MKGTEALPSRCAKKKFQLQQSESWPGSEIQEVAGNRTPHGED